MVPQVYPAVQKMRLLYASQSKAENSNLPFEEMDMTTQYTIDKIENGIATVTYSDGSWAELVLSADMTAEDVDDLAFQFGPKAGAKPSFLTVGSRTAAEKPEIVSPPEPQWLTNRKAAYGTVEGQIEYITENGLAAWQTHVAQIKADNPKPADE